MFERKAHAQNGEGDVAVFLPEMAQAPTGWRVEGRTGVWLTVPGMVDQTLSLSASSLEMAIARGRLLVVEVGEDTNRETWATLSVD